VLSARRNITFKGNLDGMTQKATDALDNVIHGGGWWPCAGIVPVVNGWSVNSGEREIVIKCSQACRVTASAQFVDQIMKMWSESDVGRLCHLGSRSRQEKSGNVLCTKRLSNSCQTVVSIGRNVNFFEELVSNGPRTHAKRSRGEIETSTVA
jgi:hypothetical protein